MTAKTNAQKQADRRERLSHDGLFKRRDFWAHPDDEPALRKFEAELREKRLNGACGVHEHSVMECKQI